MVRLDAKNATSLCPPSLRVIDRKPGSCLVGFAQGLQVDAELLAFLVEMATF